MARSSSPVVLPAFCVFGMAPMRKSWRLLPHPEPGKRSKVCRDKAVENGTGGEVKGKDGGIGDGASDEVPVGSKAFSRGIGLGLQIPVAPCRLPGKLYGVGK